MVYVGNDKTPVFNETGDHGKGWKSFSVNIGARKDFEVSLVAMMGESYKGDIAVDDMVFQDCAVKGFLILRTLCATSNLFEIKRVKISNTFPVSHILTNQSCRFRYNHSTTDRHYGDCRIRDQTDVRSYWQPISHHHMDKF